VSLRIVCAKSAALALTLLAFVACQTEPGTPPRHLLFICVDTLRADHMSLYGYPRATSPVIDQLGREGVVFEHALVQWPVTTPSMASMLSGMYPHITGVVIDATVNPLPQRMLLLPEVLQQNGFTTAAILANPVLGPQNHFDQGFDHFEKMWQAGTSDDARTVTDAALAKLEVLAGSGERIFGWVHFIDPHDPYDPPEGYAEPFFGDAHYRSRSVAPNPTNDPFRGIPLDDYTRDQENDLANYIARYDGEIRFVDEQIGRLLAGLEPLGLADDTLVVLTSDHGESLGEHEIYFNHGQVPYDEQLRVPLVMRWPDGRFAGTRLRKPVELRGLARTLASAAGIDEAANPFDGADWLAALREDDMSRLPDYVYSAAGGSATRRWRRYTLTVRNEDWKLVLPRSDWARARHGYQDLELYDLGSDPEERRNLATDREPQAVALRENLEAWFEADTPWTRRVVRRQVSVNPETEEALRELGYLEAESPPAPPAPPPTAP
jgi:arylsulfatase A-like enzyme